MNLLTNARKIYYVLKMGPKIISKEPQSFTNYVHLFYKLIRFKLGKKVPFYGSADITNRCNLKCKHCYWWKNWEPSNELSPEQWRTVIRERFKKEKLYQIALTGGEPLLRPEIIEVFNEELPKKSI